MEHLGSGNLRSRRR